MKTIQRRAQTNIHRLYKYYVSISHISSGTHSPLFAGIATSIFHSILSVYMFSAHLTLYADSLFDRMQVDVFAVALTIYPNKHHHRQ